MAGNEENLPGFEHKRRRYRFSIQGKAVEIGLVDVDLREVLFFRRGIEAASPARRENDEFLPAIDLHQKSVSASTVIMQHWKRAALTADIELDGSGTVQDSADILHHIAFRQPVGKAVLRQRLDVLHERWKKVGQDFVPKVWRRVLISRGKHAIDELRHRV